MFCYNSMLAVLTCVNIVLICCMFVVLLFCRVSNNEKKLEAVRSGVRAISVSGKIEIMHTHSQIDWFRSLISSLVPATVFLSVFPFPATSVVVFCVSLFSSLSGLPLPLCLSLSSRPLCSRFLLFTSSSPHRPFSDHPSVLTPIHIVSFPFKLWSSFPPDWLQT